MEVELLWDVVVLLVEVLLVVELLWDVVVLLVDVDCVVLVD